MLLGRHGRELYMRRGDILHGVEFRLLGVQELRSGGKMPAWLETKPACGRNDAHFTGSAL